MITPREMEEILDKVHYLGDGLYVGIDKNTQICLFTSNGMVVTNQVYLDDTPLNNLFEYFERHKITRTDK